MTKCAVKGCKNHSSVQIKKKYGVTYHRFPQDYHLREKWRKIMAIDHNDKYYKPHKTSVICSCHFSESDMYLTKKGFRRLKKTAIPRINQIHDDITNPNLSRTEMSSIYSDSDSSDSDTPYNSKKAELPRQNSTVSDAKQSYSIFFQPNNQPSDSVLNLLKTSHESSSSSSSLSSVLDTPKTLHLKKQLKICYRKINTKNKQIRNLRKQNNRLLQNNLTLKKLLQNLKEKD